MSVSVIPLVWKGKEILLLKWFSRRTKSNRHSFIHISNQKIHFLFVLIYKRQEILISTDCKFWDIVSVSAIDCHINVPSEAMFCIDQACQDILIRQKFKCLKFHFLANSITNLDFCSSKKFHFHSPPSCKMR